MMGSYCLCQQVVTFFFFFFFGLHLTTWVKGPTLTLCPGPLNFSGRPWVHDPKTGETLVKDMKALLLKLKFMCTWSFTLSVHQCLVCNLPIT